MYHWYSTFVPPVQLPVALTVTSEPAGGFAGPLTVAAFTPLVLSASDEAALVPVADIVPPVLDPKRLGLETDPGSALLDTEQLSAKSRRTVLP